MEWPILLRTSVFWERQNNLVIGNIGTRVNKVVFSSSLQYSVAKWPGTIFYHEVSVFPLQSGVIIVCLHHRAVIRYWAQPCMDSVCQNAWHRGENDKKEAGNAFCNGGYNANACIYSTEFACVCAQFDIMLSRGMGAHPEEGFWKKTCTCHGIKFKWHNHFQLDIWPGITQLGLKDGLGL